MFRQFSIKSFQSQSSFLKNLKNISVAAQNLTIPLKDVDSEIFGIINSEIGRQKKGIALIASENFTAKAVMEALGSPMTNKYSEGYPNARYFLPVLFFLFFVLYNLQMKY